MTDTPTSASGTDAAPSSDAAEDPFAGVSCPLVTPFADGAVDHDALAAVVDHVAAGGLDGLVPCGTTGEFASLSTEEYRDVLETTVDAAADHDLPVMAGTAAASVDGARERMATAAEAGADAALVTLPYFHTANDPAGYGAFLEAVAADAPLPVYLYNIPACTGAEIPADVVADTAELDAVRGLKDSGGDFTYFAELRRRTPDDFALFQGFDSLLVPGLLAGSAGGINALSNVVPGAFAAAVDAVRAGDLDRARAVQEERIASLFGHCLDHGFAPVAKLGLAARGVVPSDAVRPPLVGLDSDDAATVRAAVREATDAE